MSYVIGLVGEKNNELIISKPTVTENEPSELAADFAYDVNELSKPFLHSDVDYMYDGFDFKEDLSLLKKGYTKIEAINFLTKIVESYKSYVDNATSDINSALELIDTINSKDFNDIDKVFFIEVIF